MTGLTIAAAITGLDEGHTDRFVRVIERLSDASEVTVVVTHVYDEDDRESIREMFDVDLDAPPHLDAVAEHNTAVQELTDRLDDLGIEHTVRGAIGDPAAEILGVADDEDADFLLVGGRKRSPAGKAIFGSTAQEVLLNSSRPVIFVGADVEG